jgi:DNA repair ATPase RecN
MLTVPALVPIAALLLSLASLLVSVHARRTNKQLLNAKTRSDLLTKIGEARLKYKELNRSYRKRANAASYLSEDDICLLAEYAQFEKNTEQYYQYILSSSLSPAEMEDYRHRIEGMLLSIEHDLKLCGLTPFPRTI